MKQATRATSSLEFTVDTFGDFYKATQKVNEAIQKASNLQWEYQRMLKGNANAQEMANNLEEQR
jgi:hypothetical protein